MQKSKEVEQKVQKVNSLKREVDDACYEIARVMLEVHGKLNYCDASDLICAYECDGEFGLIWMYYEDMLVRKRELELSK